MTEHRGWQQFIAQRKFGEYPLTHRVRLEQRLIERASGADVYKTAAAALAAVDINN